MKTILIESFKEYILEVGKIGPSKIMKAFIDENEDGTPKLNKDGNIKVIGVYPELRLFRGQCKNYPLLPKLGRQNKGKELKREQELLVEVKRRGDKLVNSGLLDNWELLVYVQHFGLETRLLDWTTNPLIALWFACNDETTKDSAFVYIMDPSENDILDLTIEKSPFELKETKVFKPNLNNERIFVQNGWFTIHNYTEEVRQFQSIEENENFSKKLWCLEIPAHTKKIMLRQLDIFGVNYETIFPGIEGTCRYINWK